MTADRRRPIVTTSVATIGGVTKRKQNLISWLEELGLSSYESQAYLAALQHSPLTGYQLSKVSGVPRSRIYDTIEKLTARGLLVSQPGEKNLLSALDYRVFLDQKEKESSATIQFLREGLAMLRTPEPTGIWTVSGRERILEFAADLLGQARRYAYVVAVENDLVPVAAMLPRKRAGGPPILGVYCGDGESPLEGVIRHLGPNCSRGSEIAIVVDGERALIGNTQPEEGATAVLTPNSGVVGITEQYIKHELFLNSLYATKEKSEIQAYIRQYDRTMRKLP